MRHLRGFYEIAKEGCLLSRDFPARGAGRVGHAPGPPSSVRFTHAWASTVGLDTMREGYRQALERFHAARLGSDASTAFMPLFEALSWVASLDERLDYPDLGELRGLRFARNRVHHQWADALWLDDAGAQFPVSFPMAFFEWRWQDDAAFGR